MHTFLASHRTAFIPVFSAVFGGTRQRRTRSRCSDNAIYQSYVKSQVDLHLGYISAALSGRDYPIGHDLTAAAIQLTFTLQAARRSKLLAPHTDLLAYVDRMEARAAYKRAVDKGGPFALKLGS